MLPQTCPQANLKEAVPQLRLFFRGDSILCQVDKANQHTAVLNTYSQLSCTVFRKKSTLVILGGSSPFNLYMKRLLPLQERVNDESKTIQQGAVWSKCASLKPIIVSIVTGEIHSPCGMFFKHEYFCTLGSGASASQTIYTPWQAV